MNPGIPRVLAFRGASGLAPENTLTAFQKAIELGVHGFSMDVQMSRDGVLVVFGASGLEPYTGSPGVIWQRDYKELRRLDNGSWFGLEFKGEKIPTVAEVFQLINGRRLSLHLNIRTDLYPFTEIEQRLLKVIELYSLNSKVIFSSKNHLTVLRCKKIAPEIKTGLHITAGLSKNQIESLGVQYLYTAQKISKDFVEACHQKGLQIFTGPLESKQEIQGLLSLGIDGFITRTLFGPEVLRHRQSD